jgi:hypothetical protein
VGRDALVWRAWRLALSAIAVWAATGSSLAQSPVPDGAGSFIAFRVGADRLVAVLETVDVDKPPPPQSESTASVASFGFAPFPLPPSWNSLLATRPGRPAIGDRWRLHLSANRQIDAVAGEIVGGRLGCGGAVGLWLHVSPADAATFASSKAKYVVAAPADASAPSTISSHLDGAPAPVLAPSAKLLRGRLAALLARERPAVLAEAAEDVERGAASELAEHRAFAARIRALDRALEKGAARLDYDVQSYRLAPSGEAVHFVRAQWRVGAQQAFAAAVWLRGAQLEVIETNVRPAGWLRMWEFQGEISREHLGLVLNVFEIDGVSFVLMAHGGYESMTLALRRYTGGRFEPTTVGYTYGC